MKLTKQIKATGVEFEFASPPDQYVSKVNDAVQILSSQTKEYTDKRKVLTQKKLVPGRKKRLANLSFPHYMTFGCFDPFNAKAVLAQDSEGATGTKMDNIFIYAAWKCTTGQISPTIVLKILLCAIFQIGATIELLWAQGMVR